VAVRVLRSPVFRAREGLDKGDDVEEEGKHGGNTVPPHTEDATLPQGQSRGPCPFVVFANGSLCELRKLSVPARTGLARALASELLVRRPHPPALIDLESSSPGTKGGP